MLDVLKCRKEGIRM